MGEKKGSGKAADDIFSKVFHGSVKWFDAQKGYGFLSAEGLPKDVFVHYSAITGGGYKQLKDGQDVEFMVTSTSNGLQAAEVTGL